MLEAIEREPTPKFYKRINRGLKKAGYPELPQNPERFLGELREIFDLETNLRILDQNSPLSWKPANEAADAILILLLHLFRTAFIKNRMVEISNQPQNKSDLLVAVTLYKLQEDLGIKDSADIPRGEFMIGENGRLLWLNQDRILEERKVVGEKLPDAIELILEQEPPGLYAVRAEAIASPRRGRDKAMSLEERLSEVEQNLEDLNAGMTVAERIRELTADEIKIFIQAIRRQIEITQDVPSAGINLNSNLNFPVGSELKAILGEGSNRGINKIYDLETGRRRSEARAKEIASSELATAVREKINLAFATGVANPDERVYLYKGEEEIGFVKAENPFLLIQKEKEVSLDEAIAAITAENAQASEYYQTFIRISKKGREALIQKISSAQAMPSRPEEKKAPQEDKAGRFSERFAATRNRVENELGGSLKTEVLRLIDEASSALKDVRDEIKKLLNDIKASRSEARTKNQAEGGWRKAEEKNTGVRFPI